MILPDSHRMKHCRPKVQWRSYSRGTAAHDWSIGRRVKGHEAEQVKQCVFLFFGGGTCCNPLPTLDTHGLALPFAPFQQSWCFFFRISNLVHQPWELHHLEFSNIDLVTGGNRLHRFSIPLHLIWSGFFIKSFPVFPHLFFSSFFLGQEIRHPLHLLSRWWFDSTPNLGRWSNLTSIIFFKWVGSTVQPPTNVIHVHDQGWISAALMLGPVKLQIPQLSTCGGGMGTEPSSSKITCFFGGVAWEERLSKRSIFGLGWCELTSFVGITFGVANDQKTNSI